MYINKSLNSENDIDNGLEFNDNSGNEKFDKKLKNLKLKRIQNEESCYLKIIEMNDFEKLNAYTDKYPFIK